MAVDSRPKGFMMVKWTQDQRFLRWPIWLKAKDVHDGQLDSRPKMFTMVKWTQGQRCSRWSSGLHAKGVHDGQLDSRPKMFTMVKWTSGQRCSRWSSGLHAKDVHDGQVDFRPKVFTMVKWTQGQRCSRWSSGLHAKGVHDGQVDFRPKVFTMVKWTSGQRCSRWSSRLHAKGVHDGQVDFMPKVFTMVKWTSCQRCSRWSSRLQAKGVHDGQVDSRPIKGVHDGQVDSRPKVFTMVKWTSCQRCSLWSSGLQAKGVHDDLMQTFSRKVIEMPSQQNISMSYINSPEQIFQSTSRNNLYPWYPSVSQWTLNARSVFSLSSAPTKKTRPRRNLKDNFASFISPNWRQLPSMHLCSRNTLLSKWWLQEILPFVPPNQKNFSLLFIFSQVKKKIVSVLACKITVVLCIKKCSGHLGLNGFILSVLFHSYTLAPLGSRQGKLSIALRNWCNVNLIPEKLNTIGWYTSMLIRMSPSKFNVTLWPVGLDGKGAYVFLKNLVFAKSCNTSLNVEPSRNHIVCTNRSKIGFTYSVWHILLVVYVCPSVNGRRHTYRTFNYVVPVS